MIDRYRKRRLLRTKKRFERIQEVWGPEDSYVMLTLQHASLRPWEAAALAYLRQNDEGQVKAAQILQTARAAMWARWAVVVAALSVPLNVALTLTLTQLMDDDRPPVVVVQAPQTTTP